MFPLKAQAASPPSMMQAGWFWVHLWRYGMPCMPSFCDFVALLALVQIQPPPAFAVANSVQTETEFFFCRGKVSKLSQPCLFSAVSDGFCWRRWCQEFETIRIELSTIYWDSGVMASKLSFRDSNINVFDTKTTTKNQAYLGWRVDIEEALNCWKLFDSALALPRTVNRLFVMLSKYECLGDISLCSLRVCWFAVHYLSK